MAEKIGFIGLGNIASVGLVHLDRLPSYQGMAKNLASKAKVDGPVHVWNRTAAKAESLAASVANLAVVPSLKTLVENATVIFYCLALDADVLEMVNALVGFPCQGKTFVDCSTVHPDTTTQVASLFKAAHAHFVAMPVFGVAAMAEAGQLIVVPAGSSQDVERIRPLLVGIVARGAIDLAGQPPQQASLLKLTGNTTVVSMVEAIAEGHVLAEKTGLGGETYHQFLEAMFPGPYVAYSKRMLTGNYYDFQEPLVGVDLVLKDAGHAKALAEGKGAKLDGLNVVYEHLQGVKQARGARGDLAGLYGHVRTQSGLEYEHKA